MKKDSPVNPGGKTSNRKKSQPKIDAIHSKVVQSSALNGGFETLLFKIDKIEQSQGQLVAKVDKIHEAIYDPSEGMFAKLSEHKLESEVKLNEINKRVVELNSWKTQEEKDSVKTDEAVDKTKLKLESLEKSVEKIVQSRQTFWSIAKWFIAAIVGGSITFFFKALEHKLN